MLLMVRWISCSHAGPYTTAPQLLTDLTVSLLSTNTLRKVSNSSWGLISVTAWESTPSNSWWLCHSDWCREGGLRCCGAQALNVPQPEETGNQLVLCQHTWDRDTENSNPSEPTAASLPSVQILFKKIDKNINQLPQQGHVDLVISQVTMNI